MRAIRFLISLVFVCFLITLSNAETLRVGGIDMPPWSMEDGEIGAGINIDVFREAAKRAGYDTIYQVFSFKRKLEKFRSKKIDIDPGTNPKWRSDDGDISVYSIPFNESINVLFVRKDSEIRVETVQDLKEMRIGCISGYYYTDGFQEAFDRGTIIRDDTKHHTSNMKKLHAKRVDGIIIDKETGLYLIKQLGLNVEDFKIAYVFDIKSVLYMRIHKQKKYILPAVNNSLEEMKTDGTIQHIVDKYIK